MEEPIARIVVDDVEWKLTDTKTTYPDDTDPKKKVTVYCYSAVYGTYHSIWVCEGIAKNIDKLIAVIKDVMDTANKMGWTHTTSPDDPKVIW